MLPDSTARVLLVEDDPSLRSAMATHLRAHRYEVREAADHEEARRVLRDVSVDAVVVDHILPDGDGFDLLPTVFEQTPRPVVILLTSHGSIDLAVRAVKEGVKQFLTKPVDLPTLLRELQQYLAQRAATANRAPRVPTQSGVSRAVHAPVFGPSESSQKLRTEISRIKDVDGPVLLVGETGTGKRTLARYAHAASSRTQAPFVEVTTRKVARERMDAELFGEGSGTGFVDSAEGGTLFVDEICALEPGVQMKLLELIEAKAFRRSGGDTRRADVRVVVATNRSPEAAVRDGSLRRDLHEHVARTALFVPPLRERAEDIVPMARNFLDVLCVNLARPRATLTEEAESVLVGHSWPGNVRELKNCLERALILGDGGIVHASDVQLEGGSATIPPADMPRSLEGMEIEHIRRVLGETNGRVDAAAVLLQMPRSTLYERIRRYSIDLSQLRRRKS